MLLTATTASRETQRIKSIEPVEVNKMTQIQTDSMEEYRRDFRRGLADIVAGSLVVTPVAIGLAYTIKTYEAQLNENLPAILAGTAAAAGAYGVYKEIKSYFKNKKSDGGR